jgi:hypothetical protein
MGILKFQCNKRNFSCDLWNFDNLIFCCYFPSQSTAAHKTILQL